MLEGLTRGVTKGLKASKAKGARAAEASTRQADPAHAPGKRRKKPAPTKRGVKKSDEVGLVAYGISLDLYRTFAPLKQTAAAMAFACLELASRLVQGGLTDVEKGKGYEKWNIERAEVMGNENIFLTQP